MSDPVLNNAAILSCDLTPYVLCFCSRLARIYAYVEDVDLWRNALPGFREFSR